jgi:hypothetical protein
VTDATSDPDSADELKAIRNFWHFSDWTQWPGNLTIFLRKEY